MHDSFFRQLDENETESFRQWARDNFDPESESNPVWHPVVRDEWAKLAAQFAESLVIPQSDN